MCMLCFVLLNSVLLSLIYYVWILVEAAGEDLLQHVLSPTAHFVPRVTKQAATPVCFVTHERVTNHAAIVP